jgi:DNA-binding beta-propeller fold protein YncE
VTIDPANNKIYWTNQFSDKVRAGNLDGSGIAQTLFSGEDNPIGVTADPVAGKIYWTDLESDRVRVGPLGGRTVGVPQTLFNSPSPGGPAIDPTTNKIYWASWTSSFGIRGGNLDGTGTASTLFGNETAPVFAALLKAPLSTKAPRISGEATVGRALTCRNGTWAPDLLASFLFRAPSGVAYRWKRNGSKIASGPAFTPNVTGDYTCTVTATNQAGSTSRTSPVRKVKDA